MSSEHPTTAQTDALLTYMSSGAPIFSKQARLQTLTNRTVLYKYKDAAPLWFTGSVKVANLKSDGSVMVKVRTHRGSLTPPKRLGTLVFLVSGAAGQAAANHAAAREDIWWTIRDGAVGDDNAKIEAANQHILALEAAEEVATSGSETEEEE